MLYKCNNGRADNAWPRNVAIEATIKKPKSRKQWSLLPTTCHLSPAWHGLRPIESLISALQCQLELG